MTLPSTTVPAPARVPARFGLASVVASPPVADVHWLSETVWQSFGCGSEGQSVLGYCVAGAPTALNLGVDAGMPWGSSGPITVYDEIECMALGGTLDSIRALLQAKIDVNGPRALERALATGKDSTGALLSAAGVQSFAGADTPAGTAAVSVPRGLGVLEAWLRTIYGGVGVLHLPPIAGPYLQNMISQAGTQLQTIQGTKVAFGAGYDGTSPTGTAAATGTAWLYATGAINLLQSPDTVSPDPIGQALNRATNDVHLAVQRTYLPWWDCGAAAVLVTLP